MRNRLTAKTLKADPSFVGNPDRKDQDMRTINKYEFQEGFDTVDKGKPWEDDERGEANFPNHSKLEGGKLRASVAAAASRIRTANKATILAQMLLGEKAPVSEVKAQAREFMNLGYSGICASIRRWVATAPDEDLQFGENLEAPVAPEAPANPEVAPAVPAAPAAPAPAAPAPAPVAQAPAEEAPAVPEGGELQQEVSDLEGAEAPAENTEAPDMVIDIPEQPENIGNEALDPNAQLGQAPADPALVEAFGGEEAAPAPATPAPAPAAPAAAQPQKAGKIGIKHLATQPKLTASTKMTVEELSSLWDGLKIKGI